MAKRLVLAIAAVLAVLFMLVGCGGGDEILPEPAPPQEAVYEEEPEPAAPARPPVNNLLDGIWDLSDAEFNVKTTPDIEGISGPVYSITFEDGRYTIVQYWALTFDYMPDLALPYTLLPHFITENHLGILALHTEPVVDTFDIETFTGGLLYIVEDTGYFFITERTLIASASIDFVDEDGRSRTFEFYHTVDAPTLLSLSGPMGTRMHFSLRY